MHKKWCGNLSKLKGNFTSLEGDIDYIPSKSCIFQALIILSISHKSKHLLQQNTKPFAIADCHSNKRHTPVSHYDQPGLNSDIINKSAKVHYGVY